MFPAFAAPKTAAPLNGAMSWVLAELTRLSHANRQERWTPTVVGLQKRELAKQVLSTLGE